MANEVTLANFGSYLKNNSQIGVQSFFEFYQQLEKLRKQDDAKNIVQRSSFLKQFPSLFEEIKSLNLADKEIKKKFLESFKRIAKQMATINDNSIRGFIKNDRDAALMVSSSERIGGYLAMSKVSNSQLRNPYSEVKSLELALSICDETSEIEPSAKAKLLMLKPRLAYAAKRQEGGLSTLRDVISAAIDAVETNGDFKRFSSFFEAILAYNKAYGGE